MEALSIILPAKNEANNLVRLLPEIRRRYPESEIIVVNDGSSDETTTVCQKHNVCLISHPYSMGNGAAIKSGARAAQGEILVFMDGDGQHDPDDIARMLARLNEGYDMVVGARNSQSQASVGRWTANMIYNMLASWMVGRRIPDLTSGLRAVRANRFCEFLHLLPNGFSYPTTITMAFFRAGYAVDYIPIVAARRTGNSHIRLLRDGSRFFLIIFKVGALYSPLKLSLPMSLLFFFTAAGYYLYTFMTIGRFTNMSALLFSSSVLIFLIGLVSEQITMLVYRETGKK